MRRLSPCHRPTIMPEAIPLTPHQNFDVYVQRVTPEEARFQDLDGQIDDFLTPGETEQYRSIQHDFRKRDWLTARLAAKSLLVDYWQEVFNEAIVPVNVEVLSRRNAPPTLQVFAEGFKEAEYSLSLSHSDGYAVAALAVTPGVHVGVDVQLPRRLPRDPLSFLTKSEQQYISSRGRERDHALIEIWSLKESVAKSIGGSLWALRTKIEILCQPDTRFEINVQDPAYQHSFFAWHLELWGGGVLTCAARTDHPGL